MTDRVLNALGLWSALLLTVLWSIRAAFEPSVFGWPRWIEVVIYLGCCINICTHIWRGRIA